jgi:hypothetical protein
VLTRIAKGECSVPSYTGPDTATVDPLHAYAVTGAPAALAEATAANERTPLRRPALTPGEPQESWARRRSRLE